VDTPDADALWRELRPNERGLVAAVVQHVHSHQILMVGWMNCEALRATLERSRVTFFSRSRSRLWEKGEESGNSLLPRSMRVDCDGDVLLVQAEPLGPTCHTGKTSCFFRRVEGPNAKELPEDDGPAVSAIAVLAELFDVILARKAGRGATSVVGGSYVRTLMDAGTSAISAKIREEADELCAALEAADETDERAAAEAADLLFHTLVGLAHRGIHLEDMAEVLHKRLGRGGIDEKNAR
jgi:phosphoribosyl-ATP pyrophosphohydrolase/phosphoribosyl-AMP cyclohydrolase